MNIPKRFIITAALPYANGPIHIGHLAGVYIPADIYARYLRLRGHDVVFICGSDEHGVPITLKAKKEGVFPQKIVDKYHRIIKTSLVEFGIEFDHYARTSSKIHHETAAIFFKNLYDRSIFKEKISEQFYDESEKQFLADRYLTGTCPNCGFEDIYRDQCEKCGATIQSPNDLLNVRSTLSGNQPVLKKTRHWYLPFDEAFLNQWIKQKVQNGQWKTNVLGQVKSWLDEGLKPRAVTRDLDWGIKVPIKNADGKVLYVWFDAPIGYISATKEWAEKNGKNWKNYWQNNNSTLIHFIGKDNIVFHCLVFPQMLLSHSEDYILPTNVPANEFLNLENDKISTSKNWAVWLHEYLKDFPEKQDVLRYTLTANMPETKDNYFTWKDFQIKNNSELVGVLGNFVHRVVVLTHKYYDGIIQDAPERSIKHKEIYEKIRKIKSNISYHIDKFEFRNALSAYMNLPRLGNKFLQEQEPWKLIKDQENIKKVKEIMMIAMDIVFNIAQLTQPFLPLTYHKLKSILSLNNLEPWNKEIRAPKGHRINLPELLFSKIEDVAIDKQKQKLEERKQKNVQTNPSAVAKKESCSFKDFQKMDLRIGTILSASKVKETDRLLMLKVDTGIDTRTIVSGIAESFLPDSLIGKQVVVLANLEPRKIKGIISHGMLLLTEKSDGKMSFISPEDPIENGILVK